MEQTGSGQSIFGYTGEQTDPTGLVFLRARYYNPAVGRFLTADSVIPDPLRSGGWNRYAYVGNNPIRYTDPSGHCFWDLCLGEGAIIIGVGVLIAGGYHIYVDQQVAHMMNATTATDDPFRLPGFNSPAPGAYSQPTEGFDLLDEDITQCVQPGPNIGRPNPWQLPPFSGGQPYFGPVVPGFQTNSIPLPDVWFSDTTRYGFTRDNPGYFRRLLEQYPDILGEESKAELAVGRMPYVDENWIRYFPEHAPYLGEKLTVHHVDAWIEKPIPVSLHPGHHRPGGYRYNPGNP